MRKYVFAFFILILSLPVQADLQTKSLNQLIYDYSSPTMREYINSRSEQEKTDKIKQKEKSAEALRNARAKEIESTIKYCDSMAREWNKIEGKSGKSSLVYYDYTTGECVMPDTQSSPDIIFVMPLYIPR